MLHRQPLRRTAALALVAALGLSVQSAATTQAAPPPPAESAVSGAAGPQASVAGAAEDRRKFRTRVGTTVFENPGESTREAYVRVRRTYGGQLGAIRVFSPGLPASWDKLRNNYGRTPLVVSFRADPSEVLAGRHDATLREWFRSAPKQRTTRWSYMHEPEDDIERGELSASQYRAAWRHISALADRADNRRLRAQLTLMCWTLEKNSGRSWRDYYAGNRAVDLFAFDCYNGGHANDTYRSVRELLRHAAILSRKTGKPWGVAELGSVIVDGDDGSGRAAWLSRAVRYAKKHKARFVTYFNSDVGVDYRLHDTPSRVTWKRLVRGSV